MSNLIIVGSLRKDSENMKLAKMIQKHSGGEIFTLENIPLFNGDLEENPPKGVTELRNKYLESDNIIFVSPEYNYSYPGVLKNTIDWLSRPYGDHKMVLMGKNVAVAGTSDSFAATSRMQKDLKLLLLLMGSNVSKKDLCVQFSKGGSVLDVDEKVMDRIKRFGETFK